MKCLIACAHVGLALAMHAQPRGLAAPPFTITWLEGRCSGCEFAKSLERLQVANDYELWGIGDGAPEREGLGEHVVVHSSDRGHTWRELTYTHMHAVSPTVRFLGATIGWIFYWPTPYPVGRLVGTRDGGNTWHTVRGEFDYPTIIDATHWYETKPGKFLGTSDAGLHWTETAIPHLGQVNRTFFLSNDIGWISSTEGDDFVVFRTTDGGSTWQESRARAPAQLTDVRVLYFLDPRRGWAVTFHSLYAGSNLFATADGGKTWTRERDLSFQGMGKWTSVLCFVSESIGFAFGSEINMTKPTGNVRERIGRSQALYYLAYTDDDGATWRKESLTKPIYDCQGFRGDLRCSAGGGPSGFNVLTVHPK